MSYVTMYRQGFFDKGGKDHKGGHHKSGKHGHHKSGKKGGKGHKSGKGGFHDSGFAKKVYNLFKILT